MAPTRGWLDDQDTPHIRIAVSPEGSTVPPKEFDAIIDTGFTGFVQLPANDVAAAGLKPDSEMSLTDARGITRPTSVAWGTIHLGSETREGFVVAMPEVNEALVGVRFLEQFRKTLMFSVGRREVLLTDD